MGVEWTLNKSQHRKLTLEKKILSPLLPGFELPTFWSRVRRSYQQTIPAIGLRVTTLIIIFLVVDWTQNANNEPYAKIFRNSKTGMFSSCIGTDIRDIEIETASLYSPLRVHFSNVSAGKSCITRREKTFVNSSPSVSWKELQIIYRVTRCSFSAPLPFYETLQTLILFVKLFVFLVFSCRSIMKRP